MPVAVLLLCAFALDGCASSGKSRDAERQQDMQQRLSAIEQSLQQHRLDRETSTATLNDRMAALEQQLQMQQAQIRALSDALENIRSRPPEIRPKPAPAARPAATGDSRVTAIKPPTVKTGTDKPDLQHREAEKNAYTAAYLALKSGRYEEASQGFAELLKGYPKGEYTDQAWYWLGESLFAQHAEKAAINAFGQVVEHYPDSVKHAAALLKLGQLQQAQGHAKKAMAFYQRLIHEHPDSTAAEQARSALAAMRAATENKR